MPLSRLVLAIVLSPLVSCMPPPDLRDQFSMAEHTLLYGEQLRIEIAAPIIVLGKVLAVTDVGRPRRSPGDSRIKTQLTQIKIDVEETIKGTVKSNPIEFYFFAFSWESDVDLRRYRYHARVDERRIFFLKPWEQTYRSVGDVTQYNLPVRTGTGAKGFCRGKIPGCCIAEILLVPREDLDVDGFLYDLGPYSAYAAGELCSPSKAQELLQQLTKHPNSRIREGAADILTMVRQWWPQLK